MYAARIASAFVQVFQKFFNRVYTNLFDLADNKRFTEFVKRFQLAMVIIKNAIRDTFQFFSLKILLYKYCSTIADISSCDRI